MQRTGLVQKQGGPLSRGADWLSRLASTLRKHLQVVLSFYEKRVRQQWGLAFGKQEERLFWEQWCVRHSGFIIQGLDWESGSACASPGLPRSCKSAVHMMSMLCGLDAL